MPITFLVGLRHDGSALDVEAVRISNPASAGFRKYLSLDQASVRFGAKPADRARLMRVARTMGLEATIDPTGLFGRVTGTVAEWESAVGLPIRYVPARVGSAQWPDTPPFAQYAFDSDALPKGLARAVTWWMPSFVHYVPSLDIPGLPPPQPTARTLVYPNDADQPKPVNTGAPLGQSCLGTQKNTLAFTPFQVSTAYGMRDLQNRVDHGLQPRVALLSLGGGFLASDVAASAACFGHRAPVVDVRVGLGLPQPVVSVSMESSLDLQTVAWALHGAREIRVVQVANSATGWLEAFSLALTAWREPPHAISLSWGECEMEVDPKAGTTSAVESLFRMAAVVGVTLVTAAGDTGSSSCQSGVPGLATVAEPTVGYPASSPWMTAVGGTQLVLGANNARVSEYVWNDLQFGETGNAVGAGGPSVLFNAPWYQRPRTWSDVRSVPDVAAQAGMYPSLPLFLDGVPHTVGGTSQAAPLVASGLAMLSARLVDGARPPLGFVNPWLYRLVRLHPDVVHDVTIGDNQYPVQYAPQSFNIPGCCQAAPGYDMASGLGALLFDRLDRHLR